MGAWEEATDTWEKMADCQDAQQINRVWSWSLFFFLDLPLFRSTFGSQNDFCVDWKNVHVTPNSNVFETCAFCFSFPSSSSSSSFSRTRYQQNCLGYVRDFGLETDLRGALTDDRNELLDVLQCGAEPDRYHDKTFRLAMSLKRSRRLIAVAG